jgi:glycosyltransferase involved in cell wall biosynthesis
MPSYEGSRFVDAQIESIVAQSHTRWRLIVRDDGSKDDTAERLAAWAVREPRIEVIGDGRGPLGVVENLSTLLRVASRGAARWVALADQDDLWLPGKLAAQIEALRRLEHGDRPLLLHGDLEVVGPSAEPLHASLLRYMGLRHEARDPLATLLVQNFVTGCSAVVNRALLEVALPLPSDVVMVDWWLALCAAATGRIAFMPEAHVQYRQHTTNQVGAKGYRASLVSRVGRTLAARSDSPEELIATVRQARALEERLSERAPGTALGLVSQYTALYAPGVGRLDRVRGLARLGVGRQDRLRDLSLKLKLLTQRIEVPRP